jgi:hypothetical protein
MKPLLIAALYLLCAHAAFAECVEVGPSNPLLSAANVQITVNLDGKPLPLANLVISVVAKDGEQFLFSASADAYGVARLSDLKPGRYHVIGMGRNGIESDIFLDVSATAEKRVSYFSLNLLGPAESARHLAMALAGKMPVSEHLREFTGTVQDQSGAGIANAVVEIYRDGDGKQASTTVSLTVDEAGRFSTKLPYGVYRAIVRSDGFKPYPVVFEILQDGDAKDLSVVLKVASC